MITLFLCPLKIEPERLAILRLSSSGGNEKPLYPYWMEERCRKISARRARHMIFQARHYYIIASRHYSIARRPTIQARPH